jgi:hypothetical protein
MWADLPKTTRVAFELLALRLYVHGPEVVDRRVTRSLSRGPLWLETRNLLRGHGFTDAEVAYLTGRHRQGCPCWECVIALNRAVKKSVAKRQSRRSKPLASVRS